MIKITTENEAQAVNLEGSLCVFAILTSEDKNTDRVCL